MCIDNEYANTDCFILMQCMLMLTTAAKKRFDALPQEEKDRINEERALAGEQRRVEYNIHRGKCPTCGNKLTRGKKDKKNDYKRIWTCFNCAQDFLH